MPSLLICAILGFLLYVDRSSVRYIYNKKEVNKGKEILKRAKESLEEREGKEDRVSKEEARRKTKGVIQYAPVP